MPIYSPTDFRPYRAGIVAASGGGQANATLLSYGFNLVTVVAVASDSIILPVAVGSGRPVYVFNIGANQLFCFPDVGSAINGIGVNGAQAINVAQGRCFIDVSPGHWGSITGS